MSPALAWAVGVPLIGAVLCLMAGARVARLVAGLTALCVLAVAIDVVIAVDARGPLRHAIGGWGAPLGIELRADGLAAAMLSVVAVVVVATTAYAIREATSQPRLGGAFFSLWLFAAAALEALILSADVFNLYVTLELTTLAAVALVGVGGRSAARAGLRYLLFALPGSLAYLFGVALLYASFGTLDLARLGAALADTAGTTTTTTTTALALMTGGLCLKSALVPLHGWLPPVYGSAPTAVAALLAALVGKSSFYVLLRLWLEVFPADFALRAGTVVGVLGGVGIVWGSLLALQQARLKRVLAYSSVSQIGYLFLLFALGPEGWKGGVVLAVAHALAKASMFLAAGTVERATGHDDVDGLRGLGRHLPVTFFTLALSGVSLMGMPFSGGFIAKWLLLQAGIEGGQWWAVGLILIGGLLAAGYLFRILHRAFLPTPIDARFQAVGRGVELPALALAFVGLALGLAPEPLLELLAVGGTP